MHDTPYDPAKFFDPENAAKAPKTEPQPEPDMTKPEVVAAYIENDIADRIRGLNGDPAIIREAIDLARAQVLARYERD